LCLVVVKPAVCSVFRYDSFDFKRCPHEITNSLVITAYEGKYRHKANSYFNISHALKQAEALINRK